MEENELISVIIPIYKVEKYLRKCLDSVINQTYKNLEIILVDDGSPDACPQICDEYAKNDDRIKVIHKENGGQSTARNAALDICTGEYIAFIDSDDYVDKMYIEKLYKAAKDKNAQIAICSFFYTDETGKIWKGDKLENKVVSGDEKMFCFFRSNECIDAACFKIYHNSIWKDLRYPIGKVAEDASISDITFMKANAVCFIDEYLYYYFQRGDSAMGKFKNNGTKIALDSIEAFKGRLSRVDVNSKFYIPALFQFFDTYLYIYSKVKKGKKLKKTIRKDFKIQFKKYKHELNFKRRVKFFLFAYFPFTLKLLGKL